MSVTNIKTGEVSLVGVVLVGSQYCYLGDGDGYDFILYWNDKEGKPARYVLGMSHYNHDVEYTVDATPEVIAKWEAYKEAIKIEYAKRARIDSIRERLKSRKMWKELTPITNIPYTIVRKKLRANYEIYKLLKSNPRSPFKISMKSQVMKWLDEPNPKYNFPLSPKQLSYLAPYSPHKHYR